MGFRYKQAIVLRKDLNLSRGKAVAQGCHASIDAYDKADNKIRAEWKAEGAKKVVLSVENEKELVDLFMSAKEQNLPTSLIADAGLTEIPPGTKTAVAIGPAEESKVGKLTSSLPLLS